MDIENFKQEIENRTGVPAAILSGDTAEENIAQAKALLAYRNSQEKPTRDQFADWLDEEMGTTPAAAMDALELQEIEEAARNAAGYPKVRDGSTDGKIIHTKRQTRDVFNDWLNGTL